MPEAAAAVISSENENHRSENHAQAQVYAVNPTNDTYSNLERFGISGESLCDFDFPGMCEFYLREPSNDLLIAITVRWCVRYAKDVEEKLLKAGFKKPNAVLEREHCDFFNMYEAKNLGWYFLRPFGIGTDDLRVPSNETIATVKHALNSTIPSAEIVVLVIVMGSIAALMFFAVFVFIRALHICGSDHRYE